MRIIFDKYVHEGFAQRIATYLNKLGYRARSGKMPSTSVHPVPTLPNRSAVFLSTPGASLYWPGTCFVGIAAPDSR